MTQVDGDVQIAIEASMAASHRAEDDGLANIATASQDVTDWRQAHGGVGSVARDENHSDSFAPPVGAHLRCWAFPGHAHAIQHLTHLDRRNASL